MELDPPVPKYQNSDALSFAYPSARERWPSILTGVIDDVHRTVVALPSAATEDANAEKTKQKEVEGKNLIAQLAALKYELQHNRQLTPLEDDGQADIKLYNSELEQKGYPKWHEAEWLFSECYLYRRMAILFNLSEHWQGYDYFQRQKISTFKSSRPAVLELAAKYREIITNVRQSKSVVDTSGSVTGDEGNEGNKVSKSATLTEAERLLFIEMAEICLWGNATDLSLLTSLTYEDIQKLQGSNARKESEKNVLVNDLPKVFTILDEAKKAKKADRRVDIVLDNAGFELFVDLVLAGYLLATGLATEVVLHPKNIPWFVSDVVPKDFQELLEAMADPKSFYETPDESGKDLIPLANQEAEDVKFLFEHWSGLHADGQLIIRPNRFWTQAGSYWRLPTQASYLLDDLKQSEVVIFKGDLNYRKLVGDAAWEATTPFPKALGPLGVSSGVRILALRTCKADTVVGLPAGKDEELRALPNGGGDSGARKWSWSGKWAVVEFSDGKA